jgi:diaminopimelate decarboxylase
MDPFERIAVATAAAVFREACAAGQVQASDSAVLFHDMGTMEQRVQSLRALFPPTALHAVAIKANPLVGVLRRLVAVGAGLEAASVEEVHLALAAGCAPRNIVFDSPAKTVSELAFALSRGVRINADSFDELERLASLEPRASTSAVGLRVNPELGSGAIAATSVAGHGSKFGVSFEHDRRNIIDAFRRFDWLTTLHVHVGSQGCELSMLVAAARRALELARAVEQELGERRVRTIDLGGGLPTQYLRAEPKPSFAEYERALRAEVPELFEPGLRLITEFGRALQAGVGFAVARVEYVKRDPGRNVAILQLGADFMLREVYRPEQWRHEYAVLDRKGDVKYAEPVPVSLAGPLCFSDIIENEVLLPAIEAGDYVLIRDAGAYTLSLWSRHCSRAVPRVLGYHGPNAKDGEPRAFSVLKERESIDSIVRFWGGTPPGHR